MWDRYPLRCKTTLLSGDVRLLTSPADSRGRQGPAGFAKTREALTRRRSKGIERDGDLELPQHLRPAQERRPRRG
jgi:hypothetical protein